MKRQQQAVPSRTLKRQQSQQLPMLPMPYAWSYLSVGLVTFATKDIIQLNDINCNTILWYYINYTSRKSSIGFRRILRISGTIVVSNPVDTISTVIINISNQLICISVAMRVKSIAPILYNAKSVTLCAYVVSTKYAPVIPIPTLKNTVTKLIYSVYVT